MDLHNLVQAIRNGLVKEFHIALRIDPLSRTAKVAPEAAMPIYKRAKAQWETVKNLLGEATLQEDTITHLVSAIILELDDIFVKEACY